MKIISWNLKNIGSTKLSNKFTAGYRAYGLGNNVLDFMCNLIIGRNQWNAVPGLNTTPADVFVMIELKTGGMNKGAAASGTCMPTLQRVSAMLNQLIANDTRPGINAANYRYVYVNNPPVVGYHETVGVLFNDRVLNLGPGGACRNNVTNGWIGPRTPYESGFTVAATGTVFRIIGIHAPPPKGNNALRYREPIQYSEAMSNIQPAGVANTFYMGDFNCNPASFYTTNAGANVFPFVALWALPVPYTTRLANNTLSSTRIKVNAANLPPANYLSDAYDNIIYNAVLAPATTQELVVDMIGQARNMASNPPLPLVGSNLVALLNNYNKVSDHMPVVIQFQ